VKEEKKQEGNEEGRKEEEGLRIVTTVLLERMRVQTTVSHI
jgi:hypothetical protein